jgi:hypothetical protein
VYSPELETVPPVALHVTAVLVEPVTFAVNCWVAPVTNDIEAGLSATAMGCVTVTLADADFVVSAALVAFTVYVPAAVGAV